LNLLTGALAPDSGEIRLGANLETVTLDQRRESLDPAATLAHTLTGGGGDKVVVGGQSRHVIGYMKDFLFGPEQANTPVGVLSGGERGRLMLACALAKPANLLVLDEPTNDLDLETLDLLQELLADYPGTVLLVSHDRDFLDRVVTSVIATEGNGSWTEYAGGYSDMLAQRAGAAEQRPNPVPSAAGFARNRAQSLPDIARNRAQSPPAITRNRAQPEADIARNRARPRRLSFKERHALDTLPARIDELQSEIARLHAALADPDLYARDPAGFAARSASLARAEQALAEAEEQWLALEMLREEVEGS